MPTYAIGDIQGCHGSLVALLDRFGFDPRRDRLWFAGDLVNRGPDSLAVLRLVRDLGDRAVSVLGNHDLHLLAAAVDPKRNLKKKDTLQDILDAPDRDQLLDWLRHRPVVHREDGFTLIHAGLPPQWSSGDALHFGAELESVLRSEEYRRFLAHMYGNEPDRWDERLTGWDRLRFITNVLTRMRYCDADGRVDMKEKGPPDTVSTPLMPWYAVPGRASEGERIIFGHWSTLLLKGPVDPAYHVYPLDTGCLWGGTLLALRLEDEARFEVPCARFSRPKKR